MNLQRRREHLEGAGRHAVLAPLIFLDLLEQDADGFSKRALAQAAATRKALIWKPIAASISGVRFTNLRDRSSDDAWSDMF